MEVLRYLLYATLNPQSSSRSRPSFGGACWDKGGFLFTDDREIEVARWGAACWQPPVYCCFLAACRDRRQSTMVEGVLVQL